MITTRVIEMAVLPDNDPIFSEMCTRIAIDDEAAGEYVVVRQSCGGNDNEIRINPEEWTELRAAIDHMIGECRPDKGDG